MIYSEHFDFDIEYRLQLALCWFVLDMHIRLLSCCCHSLCSVVLVVRNSTISSYSSW